MYTHQMSYSIPCACTTLRKAARAVTRFYDAAIERAGMTTTQFAVLRAAERAGTVTMSRVADDLVMDRTSLYRTVAPMLREGWLRCVPSDDDARAKCVVITPLGRSRIACAAKEWDAAQARVVAHIGRRRWGRLSASLLEIAEQVRTWTPEEIA
jgi:DNA-binding MarR family transcriptional regulator